MDIVQLIKKAVDSSQELSQDEKKFLTDFQFNSNENLINELQGKLEEANSERDSAKGILDNYLYQAGVEKLANSYNFADKNYLEFLCKQNNIDYNDESSYAPFFNQLKESSPKLFNLDMKSGYNRSETHKPLNPINSDSRDINSLLNNAPEIK